MSVEALIAEARAFLDGHASRRPTDAAFVWGVGSDNVSLFEEGTLEEQRAVVAREKEWAAVRYDAGFGWIDGPVELGGRGLTRAHRQAYAALEQEYDVPMGACLTIGVWMVTPNSHSAKAMSSAVSPYCRLMKTAPGVVRTGFQRSKAEKYFVRFAVIFSDFQRRPTFGPGPSVASQSCQCFTSFGSAVRIAFRSGKASAVLRKQRSGLPTGVQ